MALYLAVAEDDQVEQRHGGRVNAESWWQGKVEGEPCSASPAPPHATHTQSHHIHTSPPHTHTQTSHPPPPTPTQAAFGLQRTAEFKLVALAAEGSAGVDMAKDARHTFTARETDWGALG